MTRKRQVVILIPQMVFTTFRLTHRENVHRRGGRIKFSEFFGSVISCFKGDL